MLIPVALLLGGIGLAGFLWALKSGQFDDLDGAANRILFDDDIPLQEESEKTEEESEETEEGNEEKKE